MWTDTVMFLSYYFSSSHSLENEEKFQTLSLVNPETLLHQVLTEMTFTHQFNWLQVRAIQSGVAHCPPEVIMSILIRRLD